MRETLRGFETSMMMLCVKSKVSDGVADSVSKGGDAFDEKVGQPEGRAEGKKGTGMWGRNKDSREE